MNAINTAQKRLLVSFTLLFIVVGAFWLVANGRVVFCPIYMPPKYCFSLASFRTLSGPAQFCALAVGHSLRASSCPLCHGDDSLSQRAAALVKARFPAAHAW